MPSLFSSTLPKEKPSALWNRTQSRTDSAMPREIRPDEDEVAAPPPVLTTVFVAEVWPRVDRDSLTTAEIQREIEQSVETPRHTGHSDVDFGGDDAEAGGDQ